MRVSVRQREQVRIGQGRLQVTYRMRGVREYWPQLRLVWLPDPAWAREERRRPRGTHPPSQWVRFARAWGTHTR